MRWLVALTLVLAGCGGSGSTGTGTAGGNCGSDTWANFAGNFFSTYCGQCHQWTQGSIKSDPEIVSIIQSGGMPPGGVPRPSSDEVNRLAAWINCGQP